MTNQQKTRFSGFRAPIDRTRPIRLTAILQQLDDASRNLTISKIASVRPANDESEVLNERPPFDDDRRRFLRRESTGTVRILPRTDISIPEEQLPAAFQSAPHSGQMRDLSMSGVAFVLNEPLSELATLWLRLENEHRDFAVIRPASVIRVIKTEEDQWKIMCRFDHFLPQDNVRQLGHDVC